MKKSIEKKFRQNTTKRIAKIENTKNRNKGITLIALIITIIVLLILAGVTINLTLGENGIFRTAEMAGKNYTQAQEQELAGIENFSNEINNIIGGLGSSSGQGGTIEPDTPEVTEKLLKDIAKPGDYVKYDTGTEKGVVLFRVLYNDDTNGLQIISDKNVEEVELGTYGTNDLTTFQTSMNDYNNAIATLNEKAERYATNSPYALDGRCVGSVPTVGVDGKFNAKNTEVEGTYSIPDEWTLPNGWSSRDTGCQKLTDENYEADYNTMEALEDSGVQEMLTTGEWYWLASRNVRSYSSVCFFYVRFVFTGGVLNNNNLCNVGSDGDTSGYAPEIGLRPCISLKSDIKVTGGDGKEGTPYELGI